LVAMPVAQIVAPIDRVSRDTLIVSVLILLASIPLIWLISRRVSRPLSRLVLEADEIRRFDLSDVLPTDSVVEEIQSLQRAMARMRGSLRTFALYVPKALVKQLIERDEAPELGGKRRDVTLLFTDLENFTAMASHLEPEQVMVRMSRYFETVTQALLARDATIDKYIGDAVMAFWNAPTDVPDHAGRACQAALDIIEIARRETDSWSQPGLPPLRTRIGIHCGEAIVGNVGSSDRMNYTALGATVNLAARLEALNRELGTGILVSADVVARVGERFVFRHVGKSALKGFDDGVDVFELMGVAPRPPGAAKPS
jgi:adenylate cyclase